MIFRNVYYRIEATEYRLGDPRNLPEGAAGALISVPGVRREEISVVNPAPAEGSSQCRLSRLAHVPQPRHVMASGDQ